MWRGTQEAEGTGFEYQQAGNSRAGVQIPLSPPFKSRSKERLYFFVSVVFSGFERFDELDVFPQMHPILWIHLRRIA